MKNEIPLIEQLEEYLNKHPNKENCISAKEFKTIFIMGFISQMQINVEEFFNFKLIDTNNGNCEIIATLKENNEVTCHIFKEFFLKENLKAVKELFGMPIENKAIDIGEGVVEVLK